MLVKYTGAAKFLCDHVEDASPNSQVCVAETRSSSTRLTSRLASTPRSSRTAGTHPDTTSRLVTTSHIITNEASDEIDAYHWGLIPFWADEPEEGNNQRSLRDCRRETRLRAGVGIAPCLVPSSGFYEWKAPNGGAKQPYRIYREDDPAFAMAGLWDIWEGEDETISCVTILTTEPNDLMNSIHDRMPVVLPQDAGVRLARCRSGHPQGTVPAVSEGRSRRLRDFGAGQQSRQRRSAGYRAAGPRAIGARRVQFLIADGVTVTASATPLPNRRSSIPDLDSFPPPRGGCTAPSSRGTCG